ncbi:MAG: hypothetical protein A2X84_08275 [Desulfuromonadaceae bacterium GWC2_58_13]|nr:MAG: hypothetical protein A2X84_08275 [Desulfuromonadaceae bacterium GWC2_58_13]
MPFLKGLRKKIYLTFAGLSFFFGLSLLLFVKFEYSKHLRTELEKRGISIARHLAQQSIAPILTRDPLTIKLAAIQVQRTEEDIIYIFFRDPRNGEVFAHTFGEEFPYELLDANILPAHNDHSIVHLDTELGQIYDVAVPVGRGSLGQVHVGISGKPILAAVNRLTRDILLVTLVLASASLLFSLPLSAALVRPLGHLNHAAREVAEGRFEQQMTERGHDEIGELAQSFNFMTRQLHATQQELLARNRLLADEVERRQSAEEKLASQLKFLATLMNELPEPVFYKNTQGIYLGCNRALEEFYGLPREKIIGHGSDDLFPEAEARIHNQADRDLFDNPGTCQYETPITTAEKQQRQVVCKKTTFFDSAGMLAGLVGVMIDVTAERNIDLLRREFVSTTAHEFQTPLSAILGFCELLQLPAHEMTGNRDECLAIIQERAEFLSRLVDQFLDVSRIEAGRALPLNLAPCHPERLIQRLLRNQRDNQHRFEIRFPENCPPVLADEDRLSQVIENLISNAVKYSPSQGRITITGAVEKDMMSVSVADQGVGLAESQLERIFEKFFRADTSETAPSGTGLGLFISHAIVEAHGGRISALSHPGEGVTITFTLPLAT